MSEQSVVVEREVAHPPDRVWRALTQPQLIAEWLMPGDIAAEAGHRFRLSADWGEVDCEVREVEPERRLAYSWDAGELRSVVTWTLTPTGAGTRLRMEQTGFRADQPRFFAGAQAGWPRMIDTLERVLAREEAGP